MSVLSIEIENKANGSVVDCHFELILISVFPWVISDYLSQEINLDDPKSYRDLTKPIGALNEDRLNQLKERCEEMDEPK